MFILFNKQIINGGCIKFIRQLSESDKADQSKIIYKISLNDEMYEEFGDDFEKRNKRFQQIRDFVGANVNSRQDY
jgi:hypothetical protein